jgi:hypothetical protein
VVVEEEAAVLIVLVRRHRRAVGAAVRRAVDDKVPGAIEEETGPAAVRRVPQFAVSIILKLTMWIGVEARSDQPGARA